MSIVLIATLVFALIGATQYGNLLRIIVEKEAIESKSSILSSIVAQLFVLALMIFFSSNIREKSDTFLSE